MMSGLVKQSKFQEIMFCKCFVFFFFFPHTDFLYAGTELRPVNEKMFLRPQPGTEFATLYCFSILETVSV